MSTLRKGDAVIVRGHLGAAANVFVWELAEDRVFVCSERQFAQLNSGEDAPHALGFPMNDVFYPGEAVQSVGRAVLSESEWATLRAVG